MFASSIRNHLSTEKKLFFSVVNLATEAAISESAVMRHAVSLINELGVLSSQSGKFQTIFAGEASSLYDSLNCVHYAPLGGQLGQKLSSMSLISMSPFWRH